MTRLSRSNPAGFTIIEMLLVMTIMGLISLMAVGRTSTQLTGWRITRASQALSEELQSGFSVVGRNRKPVTITLDTVNMELRLTDRNGVIYRRRNLGSTSAFRLESRDIRASRLSVEVYPPGLAADSLAFTISKTGKMVRVRMLRGGLVQICTPPATGGTDRCA